MSDSACAGAPELDDSGVLDTEQSLSTAPVNESPSVQTDRSHVSWSYCPPPWFKLSSRRRCSLYTTPPLLTTCPSSATDQPSHEQDALDLNIDLEGIKAALDSISQYEKHVYIEPISSSNSKHSSVGATAPRLSPDRLISSEEVELCKVKWEVFVQDLFSPCEKKEEDDRVGVSVAPLLVAGAAAASANNVDESDCIDGRDSPDLASLSYSSASSGVSLHRTVSTHSSDMSFDMGMPSPSESCFLSTVTDHRHFYRQPIVPPISFPTPRSSTPVRTRGRTASSSPFNKMNAAAVSFIPRQPFMSPPPKKKHQKSKSSIPASDIDSSWEPYTQPVVFTEISARGGKRSKTGAKSKTPLSLKKDDEGFFYPSDTTPHSNPSSGKHLPPSVHNKARNNAGDNRPKSASPELSYSPVDLESSMPDERNADSISALRKTKSANGTPILGAKNPSGPAWENLLASSLRKGSASLKKPQKRDSMSDEGDKLELDSEGWIRVKPNVKAAGAKARKEPSKTSKVKKTGKTSAASEKNEVVTGDDRVDKCEMNKGEPKDEEGWIVWPTLNSSPPPRPTSAAILNEEGNDSIELVWPSLNSSQPTTKQRSSSKVRHKKSATFSFPSIGSSSPSSSAVPLSSNLHMAPVPAPGSSGTTTTVHSRTTSFSFSHVPPPPHHMQMPLLPNPGNPLLIPLATAAGVALFPPPGPPLPPPQQANQPSQLTAGQQQPGQQPNPYAYMLHQQQPQHMNHSPSNVVLSLVPGTSAGAASAPPAAASYFPVIPVMPSHLHHPYQQHQRHLSHQLSMAHSHQFAAAAYMTQPPQMTGVPGAAATGWIGYA